MKKKIRIAFSEIILLSILLFIVLFISCSFRPNFSKPDIEGAVRVSNETCYGCHDTMKKIFQNSIHDRIAPFETGGIEKGCEACHGAGSKHAESGDPALIFSYNGKNLTPGQQSYLCVQCHTRMNWQSSEHPAHDVSCTDCHSIHTPQTGKLLAKSEPSLCFDCHQHIRAKIMMPNHHPIWEGEKTGRKRMTCSDCHDPHGSAVDGLKTDERLNDLCLKCHARYQGPYVFEHEPVIEDCCICHDPHGSIADNLLKQNEPFLCLQCHQFHFHTGKQGYDGTVPPTGSRNYTAVTSTHDSWKIATTTRCTQCHTQIHGSDLPSQSVPGSGGALTR
jgi:DmsE family decaheme c-type cytochrome